MPGRRLVRRSGLWRCAKPARDLDDLLTCGVGARMGIDVLLPGAEVVLQVWVGVAAAQGTQALVAYPPRSVTVNDATDQVCGFTGRRLVPVEVKIQQPQGVSETGGNELFPAVGVTQHQWRGERVDRRHQVGQGPGAALVVRYPQSASKRALKACSRIASACSRSAIAGDSSQPWVAWL